MVRAKRSRKLHRIISNDLLEKVEELNTKLTIANKALRTETAKRKRVEKVLEQLEKKYHPLMPNMEESVSLIIKMEGERQQHQKMGEVGNILAPALAHDLRNLLASIRSHAQLYIDSGGLGSPLDDNIQMIYQCSQRASNLVREFLDLVKSIKFDIQNYGPVNVNEVVTRVWNMIKLNVDPRQISFRIELEDDLPEIAGDAEKLERVFLNLFQNAIQAISERGKIMVQTHSVPSESMVEIKVMDDGPGIPESYRHRIFEPFFSTKEEGTGLGLSICKTILDQHKGNITVDDGEKQGTKFSVKLPILPPRDAVNSISSFRASSKMA